MSVLVFADSGTASRAATQSIVPRSETPSPPATAPCSAWRRAPHPRRSMRILVALHRGGELSFRERRHVQPRRVLSDPAAGPQELPGLHAPASLQPRRSAGQSGSFSRRHRARGVRRRARRAVRPLDRRRWRTRPPAPGNRPQRPHRFQRAERACLSRRRWQLPSRLVELHPVTRADAAREFGGAERVIPRALTMGVATDPRRPVDRDAGHRIAQGRGGRQGSERSP